MARSSKSVVLSVCLVLAACGDDGGQPIGESQAGEGGGEHSGEGNEAGHDEGAEGSEGGEEAATQFGKQDPYDETRAGVRLVLMYDPETDSFVGTVENTTEMTLEMVRVEVHLSNGTELGPEQLGDLEPGESVEVTLDAMGEDFETWSAHPEVGTQEAEHAAAA